MSREAVMDAVRKALTPRPSAPSLPPFLEPPAFPDLAGTFLEALKAAGGSGELSSDPHGPVRAAHELLAGKSAPRILLEGDRRIEAEFRKGFPEARIDTALDPADCAYDLAVTGADYAVAETGTLVQVSGPVRGRLPSLVPAAHLVLIPLEALRAGLGEVLAELEAGGLGGAAATCITGPSRTADIEQVLTIGVHGPGRLHVILGKGGA